MGQDSVVMVKELFRDKELTEFIIATIPTVLGINESRRLLQALRKEQIPCRRIIINQVSHTRRKPNRQRRHLSCNPVPQLQCLVCDV